MWSSVLAIGLGSAIGGILRWSVSLASQSVSGSTVMGTWLVNIGASFLVGIGLAFFPVRTDFPEWVRLFAIVGFCGGFSTFSAFSGEVVSLLMEGRHFLALGLSFGHVFASVFATFCGLGVVQVARIFN